MPRSARRAWLAGVVAVACLSAAAGARLWWRREPGDARDVRLALAAGQFAEAAAPLGRWLSGHPGSAEAHYLAGRVALGLGDVPGAARELARARELGHPGPQVALLGALIGSKLGRHAEAGPILGRAFDRADGPDPQLDEALAKVCLETYDLDRAARVLDRWAREAPHDPRPFLWRAEADRRSTGDPALALSAFREALRRDPASAEARLGTADALRQLHRNDEAGAEYEAYLARRPDDAAAQLGAGQNLMVKGDAAAGLRHIERALELDPKGAPALKEIADYDLRRGEFARALANLDRAIAIDPDDPLLLRRRVLALARLGRAAEAGAAQAAATRVQADLDRLVAIRRGLIASPRDRGLQLGAARWMFDHGHDAEGARWAEQVLRDAPGDPEASRLLAEHHARRGDAGLANFYRLRAAPGP